MADPEFARIFFSLDDHLAGSRTAGIDETEPELRAYCLASFTFADLSLR